MLKLLLTSSGIANKSIENALIDLLGKPIAEAKALFVPTAIYPFPQGAFMAWQAMSGQSKSRLSQLGWKSFGILELTTLPGIDKKVWMQSIEEADALLVWGGDPLYLSYWLSQLLQALMISGFSQSSIYLKLKRGRKHRSNWVSVTPSKKKQKTAFTSVLQPIKRNAS